MWSLLNTLTSLSVPEEQPHFHSGLAGPGRRYLPQSAFAFFQPRAPCLAGRMVFLMSAGSPRAAVGERPEHLGLLGLCVLPLWDPGLKSKQFFSLSDKSH